MVRRWYAVIVATMVVIVPTSFLPEGFHVDARPLPYEMNDIDASSNATIGNVETETILAAESVQAVAAAASGVELAATNNKSIDCTDSSSFKYKRKKGCSWVKKRTKQRCRKKKIARQCRETCNYKKCNSQQKLTVGVYYYPWWGGDFHRGNPNNPDLYLRRQLSGPQQFPELGEYDDRDESVISKHLEWSRDHNIGLWVTSWWGEKNSAGKLRREDQTIKNHILENPELRDNKIAIFYETTGRISKSSNYDLMNVRSDLEYLCEEYFNHENYYRMGVDEDGNADANSETTRPVLFVYLTRKLEDLNILEDTIALMRLGAKDGGCDDIFIVGDQVFQGPPQTQSEVDLIPFGLLDAVTNYDVYGSMRGDTYKGYVGNRENVANYYKDQNQWRAIANANDCAFVPGVSPGFNDRGVRPEVERIPLSRKLNQDDSEGSLFRAALEEARTIVDPAMGNLIMVNSFNEWHEDTQIEPCVSAEGGEGPSTITNQHDDLTYNLTYGLEYEAYGGLYLNILKTETESWDSSMLLPAPESSFLLPAAGAKAAAEVWISPNGDVGGNRDDIVTISDTIGWEQE